MYSNDKFREELLSKLSKETLITQVVVWKNSYRSPLLSCTSLLIRRKHTLEVINLLLRHTGKEIIYEIDF